ncbi:MAG: RNA-binding S4 domain-containing protein [Oscillospiraceae bacterium]|jgi:ribosome-associated protein|nr:RNA-binding S4 domain-containing protein [Oscillospiraceae bacterium]
MPQAIAIRTGEIRLDAFLKLANAAESGGQAKLAIQDGKVRVNGEVCQQRGRKLRAGDAVRYSGQIFTVEQMKKNTSAEK